MNDEVLAGLKAKIESEFVAFELTVRRGLAHIRAIGLYLIECQEALKAEGVGFKRWIEAEFAGKFSYPTAWNWMSVARHWAEFSEDELAQMTMKQMLKAVADRNRWGGPPPEETPAQEQPEPATEGDNDDHRPTGLKLVPAPTDDDRPSAVEPLEYGQRLPLNAEPVATTMLAPSDTETPGELTTLLVITSPDTTPEDRVEAVARELDIPVDKLRAALVRLGYFPHDHL